MEKESTDLEKFASALQTEEPVVEDDQTQEYDPLLNEQEDDDEEGELSEEVDEDDADVEDVDTDTEDPEEEGTDSEGPSDAMLAVARLRSVPEELLSLARSDADVSKLLDHFQPAAEGQQEQPQPEESHDEDSMAVSDFLSEEDFDESDPAHKALSKIVDALNEERKTNRLLLQHASHQMRQQQEAEARQIQQPFDEALDGMESPLFGSANKGLTQSQIEARRKAFNGYLSLVEGEPPERRKELAEAAVRAKFSTMFKQKPDMKRKKALAKQSRKRLGASKGRAEPTKLTPEEEFAKRLMALSGPT